jgi:hypothetical protein
MHCACLATSRSHVHISIGRSKPSVVKANPERKCVPQGFITNLLCHRVDVIVGTAQKHFRLFVASGIADDVESGQPRLSPRSNKDERWLVWSVIVDGREARLIHCSHPE